MYKQIIACAAFLGFAFVLAGDTPGAVVIQATNNTKVPSIHYIVDAVECLKEAYEIYDTDQLRADAYIQLFNETHPGAWNVVVGYTAISIHSEIYIECEVTGGKQKKSDDKKGGSNYLIFSA